MTQKNPQAVPFNRIYYFFGILCFSIYAAIHGLAGNTLVTVACGINAGALIVSIVLQMRGKLKHWHNDFTILILSLTLLVVCSQLGMRGLIITFPLIAGYFYYYPIKKALYFSIAFTVTALLSASMVMPPDMVLRTIIPLTMTTVISYLYADKVLKQQTRLLEDAERDHLTGIQNRRSLIRWLRAKMKQKSHNQSLSVFFIDIDNFKFINDQFGHSFGDRVLIKIAHHLEQLLAEEIDKSQSCVLARVAGDGFIFALYGTHDQAHLARSAEQLLDRISQNYQVGEIKLQVNVSIGVATADEQNEVDTLINRADVAMYKAKQLGRNRIAFYNEELAEETQQRNTVSTLIKQALENDEFYLVYMPLYGHMGKHIVGAEALLRCNNETLGKLGPDVYIPIAEEQGLIGEIDLMVIDKAFSATKELTRAGAHCNFVLAINISSQQLKNQRFPHQVMALAEAYHIPPHRVEFEITETSFVEHDESSINIIHRLKHHGFRFALDDFGTGYTAFNQLRNLPVDTLKIDRSFIGNIDSNGIDQGELVDVILSLAQRYGLNVVAEGVENQHQLDYLTKRDCAHFQGYFLSKPLPLAQLTEQLANSTSKDSETSV